MIVQRLIDLFRSIFCGREDVHAERYYSKKKDTYGYGPVCANKFDREKGCKLGPSKVASACSDCSIADMVAIDDDVIRDHLEGNSVRGIYPLLKDNTCWFTAVDFDNHDDDPQATVQALEEAQRFWEVCQEHDLPAYIERSRSGQGFHVWLFFYSPLPARKPRLLIREGLFSQANIDPKKGKFDRIFPHQDRHSGRGFGNLIALPFQCSLMTEGKSVFIDPLDDHQPFEDQWEFLERIERVSEEQIDTLLKEFDLKQKKPSGKSKSQSSTPPAPEEERTANPLRIVEQCSFFRHCRDDAATLPEPHWWIMIAILARCTNGHQLAHEWSQPYPNYSPDETDKKLEQVLAAGPHTCQYIKDDIGFGGCQTCPENVTTPLLLGIVWEGIMEIGGRYIQRKRSRKGDPIDTPISSFVIQTKERIWVEGKEGVKVDLVAGDTVCPDVVLERDVWSNRERFLRALPSVDCQFEGNDIDVQKILGLVARQKAPTRQGTRKLGYHPSVWLTGDRGINGEGWVENPEVVYVPNAGHVSGIGERMDYRTLSDKEYAALITDLVVFLPEVNTAINMVLCIGWFLACPFKPLILGEIGHFPILNCWGTRGSGKSTLLRLMARLSGLKGRELFSCTGTEFTMLRLLSATTSIPILLDEYKPYDMRSARTHALSRFLRRVYDGDIEYRGRQNQSMTEYSLTSPVAVAGEVALSESALLERVIPLRLSPIDIQGRSGPQGAMMALSGLPLEGFIDRYIQHVYQIDFSAHWSTAEHTVDAIIGSRSIPPRIRDNMIVAAFGWMQFTSYCESHGTQVAPSFELEPALSYMMAELLEGGEQTKTAADQLLEALSVLAETGRLGRNVHYAVRGSTLGLRLESCLGEFRKYVRDTQANVEVLDRNAYLQQFREMATRSGYVLSSGKNFWMGTESKRCVLIDRDRAAASRLDLQGFTEVSADPWGESARKEPEKMSKN